MPTARRKHARPSAGVVIPEKLYFRIGEVSELAQLPTYVLRYWESEFAQLRPAKSSTGQRMYRRKDVECVMQIRRLLYDEGFTIAGARERMREEQRQQRAPVPIDSVAAELEPARTAEAAAAQAPPPATPHAPVRVEEAQPSLFPPMMDLTTQSELRRLRQHLNELLAMLR